MLIFRHRSVVDFPSCIRIALSTFTLSLSFKADLKKLSILITDSYKRKSCNYFCFSCSKVNLEPIQFIIESSQKYLSTMSKIIFSTFCLFALLAIGQGIFLEKLLLPDLHHGLDLHSGLHLPGLTITKSFGPLLFSKTLPSFSLIKSFPLIHKEIIPIVKIPIPVKVPIPYKVPIIIPKPAYPAYPPPPPSYGGYEGGYEP